MNKQKHRLNSTRLYTHTACIHYFNCTLVEFVVLVLTSWRTFEAQPQSNVPPTNKIRNLSVSAQAANFNCFEVGSRTHRATINSLQIITSFGILTLYTTVIIIASLLSKLIYLKASLSCP